MPESQEPSVDCMEEIAQLHAQMQRLAAELRRLKETNPNAGEKTLRGHVEDHIRQSPSLSVVLALALGLLTAKALIAPRRGRAHHASRKLEDMLARVEPLDRRMESLNRQLRRSLSLVNQTAKAAQSSFAAKVSSGTDGLLSLLGVLSSALSKRDAPSPKEPRKP